ncbi:MAG: hypothetical protein OEW04_12530 [Nitrospirota bacterium]|nr:hypothetical protein [Nitrospirota bacterium]
MKAVSYKTILVVLFFAGLLNSGWLLLALSASAQNQEVGIHEIKAAPEKFLNKKITVRGRLRSTGRNYFTDPQFVIEDDAGNSVDVSPWVPLEVPPPMPGKEQSPGDRPLVMRDFLGRKLSVSGTVRIDHMKGKHFLDVESAAEETGQ